MRIEHTTLINAPLERVWAVTLDVEGLPELSPTTMTRVRRLDEGDLRVGSRTRIKQPGQRERVWTVEEVTAPTRFVWSTRLGPLAIRATHLLAAERDGGTRNTLVIDLLGPGARLLGALLRRTFAAVLATENAGFKRVSESAAADH